MAKGRGTCDGMKRIFRGISSSFPVLCDGVLFGYVFGVFVELFAGQEFRGKISRNARALFLF